MAFALILSEAKFTAQRMDTQAVVTLEKDAGGYAITAVQLTIKAKIPDIDQAKFDELVNIAKSSCPVSKVLNAKISLTATLLP
jgi:lipoyl-dependent peroxiredoxin